MLIENETERIRGRIAIRTRSWELGRISAVFNWRPTDGVTGND